MIRTMARRNPSGEPSVAAVFVVSMALLVGVVALTYKIMPPAPPGGGR